MKIITKKYIARSLEKRYYRMTYKNREREKEREKKK